jgi:hypothetical protein
MPRIYDTASVESLVLRAKSARARRQVAREGSEAWLQATVDERAAIDDLKQAFGMTLTSQAIEWLLEPHPHRLT